MTQPDELPEIRWGRVLLIILAVLVLGLVVAAILFLSGVEGN